MDVVREVVYEIWQEARNWYEPIVHEGDHVRRQRLAEGLDTAFDQTISWCRQEFDLAFRLSLLRMTVKFRRNAKRLRRLGGREGELCESDHNLSSPPGDHPH